MIIGVIVRQQTQWWMSEQKMIPKDKVISVLVFGRQKSSVAKIVFNDQKVLLKHKHIWQIIETKRKYLKCCYSVPEVVRQTERNLKFLFHKRLSLLILLMFVDLKPKYCYYFHSYQHFWQIFKMKHSFVLLINFEFNEKTLNYRKTDENNEIFSKRKIWKFFRIN